MLPDSFHGRRFQLWAYVVGHRQLLLRSNKSERHTHRCEILFKNVARLDLPTLIDDLELRIATPGMVPAAAAELGALDLGNRQLYVIEGRNCLGYVVAGAMAANEDDEEYFAPSGLLQT